MASIPGRTGGRHPARDPGMLLGLPCVQFVPVDDQEGRALLSVETVGPPPAARPELQQDYRRAFQGHAPADQLATEVVRRTLTGRAHRAAPLCKAAVVGQKGQVARVLGRVAISTVTCAVAMDPVLAGAARRR